MSTISSSSTTSSSYSSTTKSIKVAIPENLSAYLSNIESDSDNFTVSMKKLYKQVKSIESENSNSSSSSTATTNASKLTTLMKNFVSYYNDIVSDNSSYDDEGLKKLSKKMKKIVEKKSSELSSLGITIGTNGKLTANETTLSAASTSGDLCEFINNNDNKSGLFYEMKKIAAKLNEDSTYYLSDKSKQVIKKSSNSTGSSSTVQSTNSTLNTYA